MEKVNGADASASPLAPATVATLEQPLSTQANVTTEVSRFMPVMNITQAISRRQVIVQAMQQLMQEGVDYGKVPGSEKPTLLQPGADKLCNLFGLVIRYEILTRIEDWSGTEHGGEPFFYYVVLGKAYRGEFLIGEGIGSCNSWEAKYRWRKAERTCPACGAENIRKSRDSGWYCWKKTGGCGAVFTDGDQRIEGQPTGRKPNPDVYDCVNTVQKMGFKRCKVATTINATSAAEFFTQDVEDLDLPDMRTIRDNARQTDTGGRPVGTQGAADYVSQQKIEELKNDRGTATGKITSGHVRRLAASVREQMGETAYLRLLEGFSCRTIDDSFRSAEKAKAIYSALLAISEKEVA